MREVAAGALFGVWGVVRRRVLPVVALWLAACGGGGGDDLTALFLESFVVRDIGQGSCQVVGRVVNTDSRKTCEGCVAFNGFDASFAILARAEDCEQRVPPDTRSDFSAIFLDADGDSMPCARFAHVRPAGLEQTCE
ncbi:MAG: hypothetical protein ACRD2A_25145 [Vicinamibacterales bacterium]